MKELISVGREGFFGRRSVVNRSIPFMCRKKTLNIGSTQNLNVVTGLDDIDTVKLGGNAFIDKRNVIFIRLLEKSVNAGEDTVSKLRSGGGKEKVIDLSKHKNLGTKGA